MFKKGDNCEFENYRSVSCLPAAAKLLEKVACEQTSKLMEENNLLPKSQHGFRARHSTMTVEEIAAVSIFSIAHTLPDLEVGVGEPVLVHKDYWNEWW